MAIVCNSVSSEQWFLKGTGQDHFTGPSNDSRASSLVSRLHRANHRSYANPTCFPLPVVSETTVNTYSTGSMRASCVGCQFFPSTTVL